ncbi:alpha/beta hydrolase [Myroides sp. LJL116]
MIRSLFLIIFTFSFAVLHAQQLHIKQYGNEKNPPILFLHGGPGFNSISFEASTAQKLADSGFFVIVYDRKGEGRSKDLNSNYTFKESSSDIESILSKYNIEKINLLAHSFGGVIACEFAQEYPDKVESIIFLSAPFSYPNMLKETLGSLKEIYTKKQDVVNLNYVAMIENMNPSSLEYSSYILMHAMGNNFYSPSSLSPEAKNLYSDLSKNSDYVLFSQSPDYKSPLGFWKNQGYTSIDLENAVKTILANNIKLYGIYGQEDGIIPPSEINTIRRLLTDNNVKYLEDCSHNVFLDQQSLLIENIKNWVK